MGGGGGRDTMSLPVVRRFPETARHDPGGTAIAVFPGVIGFIVYSGPNPGLRSQGEHYAFFRSLTCRPSTHPNCTAPSEHSWFGPNPGWCRAGCVPTRLAILCALAVPLHLLLLSGVLFQGVFGWILPPVAVGDHAIATVVSAACVGFCKTSPYFLTWRCCYRFARQ